MNFSLIIMLQRTIELLAFYLILANIDGKNLKESFIRLFITKQKTLYGNMVLLVIYPLAMMLLVGMTRDNGYLIDQVFRLFVAFFLLRRVFDLRKALLAHLFTMIIGLIVSMVALIFSLDGLFAFLWILSIIMFMSHQNYFEDVYVHLLKRNWLLNTLSILSFVTYMLPFFFERLPLFTLVMVITFPALAIIIQIYFHKEKISIIDRIKEATDDEFFPMLKDLSSEHTEERIMHQYIIKNQNILEVAPLLLKRLDIHKMLGMIKDYECIIAKRQIKINIYRR